MTKSEFDAPAPPCGAAVEKKDAGKIRMELLDGVPNALRLCAAVLTVGAVKYEDHGYHRVPDGVRRYAGARCRHYNAAAAGALAERASGRPGAALRALDDESNLPHLAHAAVSALIELELALKEEGRTVESFWRDVRMPGGEK